MSGTTLFDQLRNFVAGDSAPSEQIALGSAVELVRLINGKAVDMATSLPTLAGGQITFGEILASRTEGVTRRNGTVGTDYVRVHELGQDTAKQWIPELKKLPAKANSGFAGKKNSASPKSATPTPTDGVSKAEFSAFAEMMVGALEAIASGKVAPTVAEGHTIPASPEKRDFVKLAKGQVVEIDGELMQVTEDGKRLRRTIDENTAVY